MYCAIRVDADEPAEARRMESEPTHGAFWYPSGALERRAEFFGGQLSGSYQEWYPNGRPSAEGRFLSGEKVGSWLYWDRAGKTRRQQYGG
jgi:antitoxin component YwqK of YwqJK toxin-antitoxin module